MSGPCDFSVSPSPKNQDFGFFFTLWSGPGAAVTWDLDLDMTIRDDGQVFNNSWLFCVKNNTLNHFDTIAFSSLGVI